MVKDFEEINMKTWSMREQFCYYTQIAPTTYSVNVNLDVSHVLEKAKAKNTKFFAVYLYVVTRAINNIEQFRVALNDGKLGHYKVLTPAYPQFHLDDKTTSLLFTEYKEDFKLFYKDYINDTNKYANDHGIITTKGIPPKNTFIISCIPWFTFNSFSIINHGIKDYYFPSFESGKFTCEGNKILMPLSITVHHATVDGYHIKELLEKIQYDFDNPDEWITK